MFQRIAYEEKNKNHPKSVFFFTYLKNDLLINDWQFVDL